MHEAINPLAITIRPAAAEDAEGITRTYMESSEHHARLDPERYRVPEVDAIAARYRERGSASFESKESATGGPSFPTEARSAGQPMPGITLVAEIADPLKQEKPGQGTQTEIVGFVDVELYRSPDPMLREFLYCHVMEIAVNSRYQSQGIGERLLRAAEEWGRQQGAEFALLEYLTANTRAGEFYQRRMGYRVAAMMAVKRL